MDTLVFQEIFGGFWNGAQFTKMFSLGLMWMNGLWDHELWSLGLVYGSWEDNGTIQRYKVSLILRSLICCSCLLLVYGRPSNYRYIIISTTWIWIHDINHDIMIQSPTELWKKIKRFNLQAPPVYDRKVTNLFFSIIIFSIIIFFFP